MSHLLQLLLLLIVVLLASKYAGYLSTRLGQPAVFGKILLGLLLGPTLLDILNWHIGSFYIFGGLPHTQLHDVALAQGSAGGAALLATMRDLAGLGVLLLMFMAGIETDLGQLRRVGRVALWAALGGVVLPLLCGVATTAGFTVLGLQFDLYSALFIGVLLTATSVSITAQTLIELRQLRSNTGSAIMGAAVIDDVIGIVLLSLIIAFRPAAELAGHQPESLLDWIMLGLAGAGVAEPGLAWLRIVLLIVLMMAFFAAAVSAERWLVRPLLRRFETMQVNQGVAAAALLLAFIYAWAAEWIGNVAAITGAYIAGVLIARSKLRLEVEDKLNTLAYGFFVPVFLVSIGLEADARPVFAPLASISTMTREQWLLLAFCLSLIAIAVLSKVVGCSAGARLAGFSRRDGLRVGVGMISRGEVGLIIALVGLNAGIVERELFSIIVLLVLVTTLVTPIWLRAVHKESSDTEVADAAELPAD